MSDQAPFTTQRDQVDQSEFLGPFKLTVMNSRRNWVPMCEVEDLGEAIAAASRCADILGEDRVKLLDSNRRAMG